MDSIEKIKEGLLILNNLYDVVRIIDPINKKNVIIKDDEVQELKGDCYAHWKRNTFCKNCISMRAFLNNDSFVKIEYDRDRIILVTATPVKVSEKTYILETLKNITKNGSIVHKSNKSACGVEELISEMNEKAIRDELTGIYNRRYLNETLPVDINCSVKHKRPIAIIMADIDFFKGVNDKYGHAIGDKVLVDFTNLILNSINNTTDWVSRYGGEEFVIVLNNTSHRKAITIAEKIRSIIENTTFQYKDDGIKITLSLGVYCVNDNDINMDIDQLISKADKNLYKAKISGRNRAVTS